MYQALVHAIDGVLSRFKYYMSTMPIPQRLDAIDIYWTLRKETTLFTTNDEYASEFLKRFLQRYVDLLSLSRRCCMFVSLINSISRFRSRFPLALFVDRIRSATNPQAHQIQAQPPQAPQAAAIAAGRIAVQLFPRSTELSEKISSFGRNPRLQYVSPCAATCAMLCVCVCVCACVCVRVCVVADRSLLYLALELRCD
jgi:hypothetical protein